MYRHQQPPNCVQVELTEGCNLRCSFCGLNGIRGDKREWKFLTTAVAHQISKLIAGAGWSPRIEFAMHGEPTLNQRAADIVGVFRAALPRASIMMTSNGGGLLRKPGAAHNIDALFDAGLNVLALDDYEGAGLVPRIRDSLRSHLSYYDTFEYPDDKLGNPHYRRAASQRHLVFIAPIDLSSKGNHATLNNHCGAAAPLDNSAQGKRCAKPFREISFRYDGGMAICCNDWRGAMRIGNAMEVDDIQDLWQHPAMGAARRLLYRGDRSEGPCAGCNALSYRPGLLPDHKGLETLPMPTDADREEVRAACTQRPMALAVLRPWEGKRALRKR